MRRRSERKKSTDISSPVPGSRRTNRRRKSQVSDDETKICKPNKVITAEEEEHDSSDEPLNNIRRRSSRNRTPMKERKSPLKRSRSNRNISPELKIKTIPEETDCSVDVVDDHKNETNEGVTLELAPTELETNADKLLLSNEESKEGSSPLAAPIQVLFDNNEDDKGETVLNAHVNASGVNSNLNKQLSPSQILVAEDTKVESYDKDMSNIVKLAPMEIVDKGNPEISKAPEHCKDKDLNDISQFKYDIVSGPLLSNKSEEVKCNHEVKGNNCSNVVTDTRRIRKRRWITKRATEGKPSVLAISTDSLKSLIAEVHPVPLSDVQLDTSSDVEELNNLEREEGENSPSPVPELHLESTEKMDRAVKSSSTKSQKNVQHIVKDIAVVPEAGVGCNSIQRSPSPARNQCSNVLYITNLVRPFTVLQLKGLLARTGKITENGFWIDRIKSRCFVEYETEDEAIETRHALHGVRWPISNPKCLNVDFGLKVDMVKAIDTTKDDNAKFGQDGSKNNMLVGSGWNRDRQDVEIKISRPVREWDVGKKENVDKVTKEGEKHRGHSRGRENSRQCDNERNDREKERVRRDHEIRSSTLSPVRKQKKKDNDPPLRLLDDLFRKTKAPPCIYWLPLTPEQISEKEALRQKRLEEQKQRLKLRELEREKEREKERTRQSERNNRRNRSNDRKRSRSRERRRY